MMARMEHVLHLTSPTQHVPRAQRQKRIRGPKLMRIRRAHLHANPLCVHCYARGVVAIATEVDHIVALENGGVEAEHNRQGLCKRCHEIKTAKDKGIRLARKIGLDGFPLEEERGTLRAFDGSKRMRT